MRSQRPSWPRQCAYANGADLSFGDWLIAAGGSTDDVREYVASCEDWHIYTAPVGSYRSNRFGLHDIIGNVYEWTEDCRNKNYRRAPTDGSPWTAGDCQYRVGRGGMYFSEPHELRPAKRATFRDTEKLNFLGFRVVRAIAAGQGAGRSAERGD